MTLYLSGKITGCADYYGKFYVAQKLLHEASYGTINPCYLVSESSWTYAMKIALSKMLKADGVALLPDWRKSRGARIERRIALWLKIPVRPLGAWLREKMSEPQTAREAYETSGNAGLLRYFARKCLGRPDGEEQKEADE